jgi:TRAP-type C4-dicarboxylate transport system permease small subunit
MSEEPQAPAAEGPGTILMRWVTMLSLTVLLVIVCALILLRIGIFSVSLNWTDEIVELLFAWMVFLGSAIVWGRRQHIVVDLIPQMLAGTRAAQVLEIVACALCLVFFVVFTWYGGLLTLEARGNTSPILTLPRELWYAATPVAGAVMIWHTLRQGLAAIRGMK